MAEAATGDAKSAPVSPTFTTGTVTATTRATTTVSEIINQVDYTTGDAYTVTGTNINISGAPGPDATYNIAVQGQAFQFSETFLGTGVARETFIERETTIESVTETTSIFTQ